MQRERLLCTLLPGEDAIGARISGFSRKIGQLPIAFAKRVAQQWQSGGGRYSGKMKERAAQGRHVIRRNGRACKRSLGPG